MRIPNHARANFNTLLRAAAAGDLALMACTDAITGEVRHVICAAGRDGDSIVVTPFGHLCPGNPYETYRPPEIKDAAELRRRGSDRARGKGRSERD